MNIGCRNVSCLNKTIIFMYLFNNNKRLNIYFSEDFDRFFFFSPHFRIVMTVLFGGWFYCTFSLAHNAALRCCVPQSAGQFIQSHYIYFMVVL